MTPPATFLASIRIKAALCCGVAVILTAWGGGTDETVNQHSLASTMTSASPERPGPSTAGVPDSGADASRSATQETAAAVAAEEVAPGPDANGSIGASTMPPAAAGAAPTSNQFNLNGYQDAPAASLSHATTV